MLGLIDAGDEGCHMDYSAAQKKIVQETTSFPISMAERREIFAFVANNERVVRHLLDAPETSLLIQQSRMYVMDVVGGMGSFEAISTGGKLTKTWHNQTLDQTVTLVQPLDE